MEQRYSLMLPLAIALATACGCTSVPSGRPRWLPDQISADLGRISTTISKDLQELKATRSFAKGCLVLTSRDGASTRLNGYPPWAFSRLDSVSSSRTEGNRDSIVDLVCLGTSQSNDILKLATFLEDNRVSFDTYEVENFDRFRYAFLVSLPRDRYLTILFGGSPRSRDLGSPRCSVEDIFVIAVKDHASKAIFYSWPGAGNKYPRYCIRSIADWFAMKLRLVSLPEFTERVLEARTIPPLPKESTLTLD